MALTKPTILSVPSFDATKDYTFLFVVQSSGAQITSNQLTIKKQSDNSTVYQETQSTFKYEHTVPANTLTNGEYYNVVVIVYDAEGNQSPASIPVQFYCYTTPVITFTNLPVNNVITNASFSFDFTYTQNEGERIDSYIVNLYNSTKTQVATSGTLYATDGTPPFSASYQFSGMESGSIYYIEVNAVTINNTIVTTGQQQFTVQYQRPNLFTLVGLENNCEEGYITITSNIVLVEGSSNPSPPTYIDDKEVDLTQPGSWVQWNNGYTINGNMTTRVWFRNPNDYSQILSFTNDAGQTIKVNFMLGYENVDSTELQAYIEVYVDSSDYGGTYYIYSNFIDVLPDTQYYNLWLTRVNNVYQVQLAAVN